MPRLHPDLLKDFPAGANRLLFAIVAVDVVEVASLLQQSPQLVNEQAGGQLLETAAATCPDKLKGAYLHVPVNQPVPLERLEGAAYTTSRTPSPQTIEAESCRIIDKLIEAGADPLVPFPHPLPSAPQRLLSAADGVFEAAVVSNHVHSKSQLVLHALNRNPDFQPDLQQILSLHETEKSVARPGQITLAVSRVRHVRHLADHIRKRLANPAEPLERQVAGILNVAQKKFWLQPDWSLKPPPPGPAAAMQKQVAGIGPVKQAVSIKPRQRKTPKAE